ncbi:ABC transporter permease [Laceyella putida]|jgi:ABC-2 type transport system permease protein|uniref:ABC transporter permease n=1 Tax=Laceyella putida TaxID=110101 RepID=A0ABW2RIU1_9BACL
MLFRDRMRRSWTKALRLIGVIASGGGTPLLVGITIIAFSFGYNQLLAWLPNDFPLAPVLAVILGLFLTRHRIRTWITPTDLVFLLPLEPQMGGYFRASLLYTGAIQLFNLSVLGVILYPLYHAKLGTAGPYAVTLLLLACAHTLNLLLEWQSLRLTVSGRWRRLHTLKGLRGVLNFLLSYAALESVWWLAILALAVLGAWYRYWTHAVPRAPYPWRRLSQLEQETVARYYAIANWFVDVPQYKRPLRERKWLIRLVNPWINREAVYPYLFWRTLARRSDLLTIHVRLLAWVLLLAFCWPHPAVITLLTFLGNWMFIVQLQSVGDAVHYPIFFKLMPRPASERVQAIRQISFLLMALFTGFTALVSFLAGWLGGTELVLFLVINGAGALMLNRRKK